MEKQLEKERELYALVPEEPERSVSTRRARAPATSSAGDPIHRAPVLTYREAATNSPADRAAFPDKAIDLHLPLALLGCGMVVEVAAALIQSRGVAGFQSTMTAIGLRLVAGPAIMLIGIFIAAKFRGIDFGHVGVAAMKLAAICIAPGAAATLLMPIASVIPIFGWLALLAVQFVLYFALIGTMFKLDESDTWYCVCVFFVLDVAVYFGGMWVMG